MEYISNDDPFYRGFKEYAHNLTTKQFNDAARVWNAHTEYGLKHIDDCYIRASHYKTRAYYSLEALVRKYDYCLDSGVIGYNTCTFSWGAIVANRAQDGIYYECFIIYATAWRTEIIPIGVIEDII